MQENSCGAVPCSTSHLGVAVVQQPDSGMNEWFSGLTVGCRGCGKCVRAFYPCRCSARNWAVPRAAGANSTRDLQQLTARQGRGAVGPLLQHCTAVMARFVGVLELRYARAGAAPTVIEMHENYSPQDAAALQQRAQQTFSESA